MEVIIFLLGIILGFLIANLVFLCYVYLELRNQNKIHKIIKKIEQIARPEAKIFMPPNEEQEAQEEIMRKNKEKGRGTNAEELGL